MVVFGQVSQRDVLPVAAVVGKTERFLVQNLDEALRSAAMLDIGRTVRRCGAEEGRVLLGDEAASSGVIRSGNPDSFFLT